MITNAKAVKVQGQDAGMLSFAHFLALLLSNAVLLMSVTNFMQIQYTWNRESTKRVV